MVIKMADDSSVSQLIKLGIGEVDSSRKKTDSFQSKDVFNVELERFQQHFGITQVESIYLLDS